MATNVKKIKWQGVDVLVEYANKDGQGNAIDSTYLKKTEYTPYTLPTAADAVLGGIKTGFTTTGKDYAVKVDGEGNAHVAVPWTDTTYTEATTTQAGLMSAADKEKLDAVEDYVLPAATTSSLGGVKIGAGLQVETDGTVSVKAGGVADSAPWSGVTGKPFNTLASADFTVTEGQELQIKADKWATQQFVTSQGFLKAADIAGKLDTATFNEFKDTTAPATYVAIEGFKEGYLDANNVVYSSDIANFITKDVQDLTHYYTSSQVDSLLGNLKNATIQVVAERPGTGEAGVIYLVGESAPYEQYVYEGDAWIDLGSTEVNLDGYVTGTNLTADQVVLGGGSSAVKASGKTIVTTLGADDNSIPTSKAVRDALGAYLTTSAASTTYATKTELGGKQDKLSLKAGEQVVTLTGTELGSNLVVTDVQVGA